MAKQIEIEAEKDEDVQAALDDLLEGHAGTSSNLGHDDHLEASNMSSNCALPLLTKAGSYGNQDGSKDFSGAATDVSLLDHTSSAFGGSAIWLKTFNIDLLSDPKRKWVWSGLQGFHSYCTVSLTLDNDDAASPATNELEFNCLLESVNCSYLRDYGVIVCKSLHNGVPCSYAVPLERLMRHCYTSKKLAESTPCGPHQITFCKISRKPSTLQIQFLKDILLDYPDIVATCGELRDLCLLPNQHGPILHIHPPIPRLSGDLSHTPVATYCRQHSVKRLAQPVACWLHYFPGTKQIGAMEHIRPYQSKELHDLVDLPRCSDTLLWKLKRAVTKHFLGLFLIEWKFAVNKNRRRRVAISAKAPSLLEEMEHVIHFYVDDVVNSWKINPLTKAQGCDHPSLGRCIAIAPGVKPPVLLLCIGRVIELVIESAHVVWNVEEFRQFLNECDGGAIYDAPIFLLEDN
ncbi:uncharacterized protein F5147DRAFT_652004 [Suillus discolor]|uniref:Uncharacterized protein n=1 Tax=Suillus discolor TaxID=1912936 RepID=A0A9P7JVB6_9AGAM|nr:uncharacterized protein F5147DRAFT_652004 [Suillus discolor]KAG2110394.1 hypothetical protein F5147DRAFT_652004 [Suillus discolor]